MRIGVNKIQCIVAGYYELPVTALTGPSRRRTLTGPRHLAMYLARELTDLSYPIIGRLFGGRDHTTILHGYAQIEKRIASDPRFSRLVDCLAERASKPERMVRGAWPDHEIDILKTVYPKQGSKAVCRILNHRTMQGVWAKARKLGLTFEKTSHPLVNFPRQCKNCGCDLHYSRSAKYLTREPTGLCRPCCNKRPRSKETIRRAAEASRRAMETNPLYRQRQREGVRAAMARISPEERERRRERGRICGLANKGNLANPAGSPCRKLAGKRAAETRRRQREAARLAELRRPKTFEEKLQAVIEGRATISRKFVAPSNDHEFTLGGVSSGWAA